MLNLNIVQWFSIKIIVASIDVLDEELM